jgi:hypothetical protein
MVGKCVDTNADEALIVRPVDAANATGTPGPVRRVARGDLPESAAAKSLFVNDISALVDANGELVEYCFFSA